MKKGKRQEGKEAFLKQLLIRQIKAIDIAETIISDILSNHSIKDRLDIEELYMAKRHKLPPFLRETELIEKSIQRLEKRTEKASKKGWDISEAKTALQEIKKEYEAMIQEGLKRLSPETVNQIKQYCKEHVVEEIVKACFDFYDAIALYGKVETKAEAKKREYLAVLKACDVILSSNVPLKTERQVFENIRQRCDAGLKKIKQTIISPMQELKLKTINLSGLLSPFHPVEWQIVNELALDNWLLKRKKGRPYDLFVKALALVVCKTIRKNSENIKMKEAYKLTADILNEFFKDKVAGWFILKPKDIENAFLSY